MKSSIRWPLSIAMSVALTAPGLAQQGAVAPLPPPPSAVVVNMRDVDIVDVAQQVSRITSRTIILDPNISGRVNVTSSTPLSPAGVWELFVSVLRGQGFAVIRTGRAWRVVSQASAVREPSAGTGTGQIVTRLIRLGRLSPDAAARIFRPIVGSFGSVEPVTRPNGIVVTDYADNVTRVERLARSLDSGSGDTAGIATITLQNASARDVATAISGVLGESEAGGPRAVGDERSNTVLVRGDTMAIAEARRIAQTLDRPTGAAATIRVFRLRFGDAESVVKVLRGLMGQGDAANNAVASTLRTNRTNPAANGATPIRGVTTPSGGLANLTDNPAARSAESLGTTVFSPDRTSEAMGGFSTDTLSVEPAPELNAIVVRGAPAEIAAIEPLIADLDVRRPQVMIEAAIVEITGDRSEALGIQLGLGSGADAVNNSAATSFSNLGLSLGQILGAIGSPLAAGLGDGFTGNFGSRGDFGVLVQALGASSRANLLSTPSITTMDNEPAEIVVGQNVPFRTGSYATDGNTTTPFTTIERADVGITLRVVPRVHEGDTIRLEVNQEVSSLVGAVTGAADLVTNRRSIQTTVLADDGQTIVLGGLISDDQLRTRSQVPVLGDIPVLGNLFKSRRESKTRRTLFVFLRPTILRDSASVAAASQVRFDRVQNAEGQLADEPSLLLEPPRARLPSELEGIY